MTYPYPSRKRQITLIIAVAAAALTVTAITLYTMMLQNPGNVTSIQTVAIEAYWDTGLTNKVTTINWGSIEAGTTKNVTIYLLNAGITDIRLSMNTTNWSPQNASQHITLNWDYQNQTINPHQQLKTTLTLNASPTTQGITSFSFDATITATQNQ